jgi:DNA-binding PadR family transcriptional regulator
MTDVEHMSQGRVRLRAGTLYAALDRLRSEALSEADREEMVGDQWRQRPHTV